MMTKVCCAIWTSFYFIGPVSIYLIDDPRHRLGVSNSYTSIITNTDSLHKETRNVSYYFLCYLSCRIET